MTAHSPTQELREAILEAVLDPEAGSNQSIADSLVDLFQEAHDALRRENGALLEALRHRGLHGPWCTPGREARALLDR